MVLWGLPICDWTLKTSGMKRPPLIVSSLVLSSALLALPPAYAADGKLHIICVGDSITAGVGAAAGGSYPEQLGALFGEKAEVEGFGVSGSTMLKSGDSPYWKSSLYQRALESEPKVVVIMLGTNDTKAKNWTKKSDFAKDYLAMIKSFQVLPSKPKVFICLPCPVVGEGNFGINEAGVKEEIPMIKKLALEANVGIIDMHTALEKSPDAIPDKVHPNEVGAALMAKAAFDAISAVK